MRLLELPESIRRVNARTAAAVTTTALIAMLNTALRAATIADEWHALLGRFVIDSMRIVYRWAAISGNCTIECSSQRVAIDESLKLALPNEHKVTHDRDETTT